MLWSQRRQFAGSAGIAYHWGDSYFDLPDDVRLGGCDNNWLDSQIGVNVQTASVGHHGPGTMVARVPRGLNGVNLRLHSATGAPDVTVTAPGGARFSTAGLAEHQIVKRPGFTAVRYPVAHLTIIAPTRPTRRALPDHAQPRLTADHPPGPAGRISAPG